MSNTNYNNSMWSSCCRFWNSNSINYPTVATLSILLFLAFITIFAIPLRKNRRGLLPPGPRGLPLLGYLPFLGADLHREFTKLSKTYGPIYKLWLGNKLCIVISSPTVAKEVVREHDLVFADRDATVASLTFTCGGSNVAFAKYGEYWRKMRKVFVREMMSNASIEACSSLRRDEVMKTIRSVYNKVGNSVDIGELVLHLVINTTMEMIWGRSVEEGLDKSLESEFREVFAESMVVLGLPNVSDFFPFIARFDIQGVAKRAEKCRQCFHSFFDSIIVRAVAERVDRTEEDETSRVNKCGQKKDILHILLDLQLTDNNFGNTELKAILQDIILGATDTTGTTIEWVMARLLYHQVAMEKVTEELTRVVGTDNMVEELHSSDLKYLDAVIKETFRLNPPLPLLIPKASRESTVLCGYNIPKGTTLFMNMWAIHRDPNVWDNPEEFRPERFLENPVTLDFYGNSFEFMPFGSGRRICPGLPLAEKMVKYVLASLLHCFHWELTEGSELDLADQFGIVLKKLNHLVAIPSPRLSNADIYTVK